MTIRSMTGYAQLTYQVNERLSFSLSLKSVNHRFLDLHFRMPAEANGLELKMRRVLKEKIARGHIEVALSLQHGEAGGSIGGVCTALWGLQGQVVVVCDHPPRAGD